MKTPKPIPALLARDAALFVIVAVLAGCGLIYEYLIAHYAGRVLGAMEAAIYGIIGLMIVAMGVGSFLARRIPCPFTGFAWLEVAIALLGSSAVLLMGGAFALANLFPRVLAETFGLPPDLLPNGALVQAIIGMARATPYLMGAVLGVLLGMEIPLVARAREILYARHLAHNTGSIYGIDYLGAGVGAGLWVFLMLSMDISLAAGLTASANIAAGLVFYGWFRGQIRWGGALLACHFLVGALVAVLATFGADWEGAMEDLLYRDTVVYRAHTRHQRLAVTERIADPARPSVLSFFINGRMQFTTADEHIYHAMLVYPALAASARRESVLVVGGGDGLAVRDILRWNPKRVVLLDLDGELVGFFTRPGSGDGGDGRDGGAGEEQWVKERFLALNEYAFSDPRVSVRVGNAFVTVDELLGAGAVFDAIVVDLPDPNHPDLNRLYSTRFYAKLKGLLAGDGAMSVQSTSPYHAKRTFLCIGKTVRRAGFLHVGQYHGNVPSFGEWGWTIATKRGAPPRARLAALETLPVESPWLTKPLMLAAFEFSRGFFDELPNIEVNRLGSMVAYRYHQRDWEKEQGIDTGD
uniref:Polyamine aminopropyltransferase n=1 Tax=Candidatus Kentrum eta TaxID=2126337 RepID=A0A450U8L3_9GAMM|nr:MAG: spermidine synthase [Candidatus Kentron sp. H]VFJ88293.1 MAG: spermidine synthase [Candidatus Kentron sp. H]VFJ95509.1 MAG: spermidine synthase [Candidatus Kentron sp. H]